MILSLRHRGLEAGVLEVLRRGHGDGGGEGCRRGRCGESCAWAPRGANFGRGRRHGYNSQFSRTFTGKSVDPTEFAPFCRAASVSPCSPAVALLGAGCATIDTYLPTLRSFGVYKLDINQGNYLSQDVVDKLKVGQTKAQVRQLLGTPLVVSVFRDNRWDYVYEFTRQGSVREHRTFTVYFVDDKLARWEGDEMPTSIAELNKVGRGDHRRRERLVRPALVVGAVRRPLQEMTMAVRIAIAGAGGRMGQALIEAMLSDRG